MAEVKQIPSAVGAYEAQIFDMSKTYNTIKSQAAAQAKAQQEAKKEADKALVEIGTMAGKARRQEIPLINKLNNELTRFYSEKGRDAVTPGTEAYTEYNKKRTDLITLINESIAEKETDKDWASFMSINADKDALSDKTMEAWKIKQLPLRTPERDSYKYPKTGVEEGVPINQIGIPDLEKFTRYHEEDTRKAIDSVNTRPLETASFAKTYLGKDVPDYTMITKKIEFKDPAQILGAFHSTFTQTRDGDRYWKKEWDSLPKEQKDRINTLYKELPKVYQAMGVPDKLQVDESDGSPGITSGYEYGAVKYLLQNLPKEVGNTIDLKLANFYQDENYRSRMLSFRREAKIKENLDTGLAKNLLDKGFSLNSYSNAFNKMIGLSGAATGTKYRPVTIKSSNDRTKTLTADVAIPLVTGDRDNRVAVDNYTQAKQMTGLDVYKPGAKEWITKDAKGKWVKVSRNTYNLNPNSIGYEGTIAAMNNEFEEALRMSGDTETYNYFKGLRSTGATMTDIGGQVEDVFMRR